MNVEALLKERPCRCGRTHRCDIRRVVIESGALAALPNLTAAYRHIVLVADDHTMAVCTEPVAALLGERCERTLVLPSGKDGVLVPNEASIAALQGALSPATDLIVGVGSGVIQDLCKYVSFQRNLPYQIVATAPSMDGYASIGAAMIIDNMKVTYKAHVPEAIIGDVDVLCQAPMDMIQAGYGDILGKVSSLNDWKLSHLINGEYFCEDVYQLTSTMQRTTEPLGEALLRRDKQAVKLLMEALVGVGIAMAYVGNSRPASGSEHHLSHFFEVTGLLNHTPYFLHGIDVAYASLYVQKLREELLALPLPARGDRLTEQEYTSLMRTIYHEVANGVIDLQKKTGYYKALDKVN